MSRRHRRSRRGNILILSAALLVGLIFVVAFAVDYGYLLVMRTDMQRAADAAALAAVRELEPDALGDQSGAEGAAKQVAREYVNTNLRASQPDLAIPDADIEVGRYDSATVNSGNVTLTNGENVVVNAVRVTLRRDGVTNPSIAMFFGRVFGTSQAKMEVKATAVLRSVVPLVPGNGILPIAVDLAHWDSMGVGETLTIYGDGKVTNNNGDVVPGNWGTVDVGNPNNSTSDLNAQIVHGLRQSDVDYLHNDVDPNGDPRIPNNREIPPDTWINGETGFSTGIKHGIAEIVHQARVVPIVDQITGGSGENSEFHVVKWGVVEVTSYKFAGSVNSYIKVRKRYVYDGNLRPNPDLSQTTATIEGGFGPAGLVE